MDTPIDAARLSYVIGLIYDSAINATRWPLAMEAIRLELNCANAALALNSLPDGNILLSESTNVPEPYRDRMTNYGAEVIEQWGGPEKVMTLPLDQPLILSRINPVALDVERTTNRYTREWAMPQGLHDVIAVGLARDDSAVGSLAFGRHVSAGPFGTREENILRLLLPHLQRAATINRLLDAATIERDAFESAIDKLSVPVLLTDGAMRILHANPAAQQVLSSGDLIHAHKGLLSATTAPLTRALEVAVERASTAIDKLDRKGLGIPIKRSDGKHGALYVLPLQRQDASTPASAAVAAVFVAQIGTPFIAPTEIVAALFGLTPVESRVFHHVAAGHTMADTAKAMGIGASTVKTHLLRIYDKTGVHRRAELQQIVAALILPLVA